MPAITDLATLKLHGKALDADLKDVFAKYGLTMDHRRGTVYSETGTLKYSIECKMGTDEDQTAKAKKIWESYAPSFNLPVDGFGKEVEFNGKQRFKVVGLNITKPKNCVMLVRLSDGKAGFQCPAEQLIRAMRYAEIFAKGTERRAAAH